VERASVSRNRFSHLFITLVEKKTKEKKNTQKQKKLKAQFF